MLIKGPHKQLAEYPINIMNMQKTVYLYSPIFEATVIKNLSL